MQRAADKHERINPTDWLVGRSMHKNPVLDERGPEPTMLNVIDQLKLGDIWPGGMQIPHHSFECDARAVQFSKSLWDVAVGANLVVELKASKLL